jgi:Fe2+ transport system protein FeoA
MSLSLDRIGAGQWAEVVELRTADPARLDRLSGYGIVPGSRLRVEQLRPAVIVCIGHTEISVDGEVARQIMVRVI